MCDTLQSQNTCRSFSPERAKDYRQGWSAAQPLPKFLSYLNGWCDTPRRFAAPLSERGWRGSDTLIIKLTIKTMR